MELISGNASFLVDVSLQYIVNWYEPDNTYK